VQVEARLSFHQSLTGPTQLPWSQAVEVAGAAGFAAIDVVLPEAAQRPPAATLNLLRETGVAPGPASLPVEFREDEERFRRDLAELPRLAGLAAELGVRTMFRSIPASSEVPAAELLPTLRRRVGEIAGILGERGIDFAVEVLGPLQRRREGRHEFIWRLHDGAEFAASCGPRVGLLVDSWHWHHARGTPEEIEALGTAILHVHVADAADVPPEAVRDEQRLLPGEGVVDHARFFAALAAAGYAGLVSPEVRGYGCDAAPRECARRAFAAIADCARTAREGR